MEMPNASSYKIYITKSFGAAQLIARGLRTATPWTREGGLILSTGAGVVGRDCRIPGIYHGSENFYAFIEYRNGEDFKCPEYQVIIC